MKEFYDLWVNHQLHHAQIASSYWVLNTTDQERRPFLNKFCARWVREHKALEWDLDRCFEDFDRYLETNSDARC